VASVASPTISDLTAAELGLGRPYAPSWLDGIVTWIDRVPGPAWLAYLVFSALALVWTTLVGWATGLVPIGSIDATQTSYAFYLVMPFATFHVLKRAAPTALRRFAPAMDATPAQLEGFEYQLTTIPARPALVIGIAAAGLDLLSWISDPVRSQVAGAPPAGLVLRAAGEFLLAAAWGVVIYQVVRQLRLVSRLHDQAVRVDLFHPAPLHAFSHLTVRAGIALVVIAAWSVITSPPDLLLTPVSVVFIGGVFVIGGAAFVLPLRGMQRRLAAEKDRLADGVSERLESTLDRLHAAVDSGDLAPADQIQKTLTALTQEREIVGRLRTWPWDPSTLRAFASAIALPIALWLVTRALERVV
jgi:hypothetical protein